MSLVCLWGNRIAAPRHLRSHRKLGILLAQCRRNGRLGLAALCCVCFLGCGESSSKSPLPVRTSAPEVISAIATPADEALLRKLCSQCHLFPNPDTLPKSEWEAT